MIRARAAVAGGLLVLLAAFAMGTETQLSTSVVGERQNCGPSISASWLVSGTPDPTGPGSTATTDERRAAAACGPVVQQARVRLAVLMGIGGLLALAGWGAVLTRTQPLSPTGRAAATGAHN